MFMVVVDIPASYHDGVDVHASYFCMVETSQGCVPSGKNLFLPNLRIKPVKIVKSQNAGIMGLYK